MEGNARLAIEKGAAYLRESGRSLDQALYAYHFEAGGLESVFAEMKAFQNSDGGFGHAYEPDLRCPDTSALCTTEAMQTCWSLGLGADHPYVQGAVEYFLNTYQKEAKGWHIIPASAMGYPRAPWWQFDPDPRTNRHNPRPEILGILWRARETVPARLLADLSEAVLTDFETDLETLQMHDLYCYLRLVRTPDLPENIHQRLMKHIPGLIEKHVDTTEEAWAGYGIRPYAVAYDTEDPFYPIVADAMPRAVAYLLKEQRQDGSWPLTWSWGESYPEAWKAAEKDWKSRGTLGNLLLLKHLAPVVNS